VVAGIGFSKYRDFQKGMAQMAAMGAEVPSVSAIKASVEKWVDQQHVIGNLRAAKGVDISNELAGIVEDIKFNSGGDVKAGTLLVKLRAEDDIAKLHALEAAARIADITYRRDKKQLKAQAISQATLDNDSAALAGAKALVAEQKAIVDKKFIKAPFSGHLGIRNIDLGQYLNPGTSIVTLQELNPIYLDFYLPEQALSQIKVGQKLTVTNDTYPGRKFSGSLIAINPKVDEATRNVRVRAALKNADHALLPGMYATAAIGVGEPHPYVTLPQTAVTYNPYGNSVYILKEGTDKDDKGNQTFTVEQSVVTLGDTRGDQVAILSGVKEGDFVVTAGQIKLQKGGKAKVDNTVVPKNDANPKPEDQ
jgi:membrane fusion protein (multidrug efflux system)